MIRITAVFARVLVIGSSIGAALLVPGASSAQSGSDLAAQVRGCLAVGRDRDRLACFDAAFADFDAQELAAAPAAAAAPAVAATTAAAAAAAAAPAPAAAPPPAPIQARSSFAQAAPVQPSIPTSVVIVEVRDSIPGEARFVTDAGDLLVQTSSRGHIVFPETPFEATIEVGALGSLFMRPEGRQAIRVTVRN